MQQSTLAPPCNSAQSINARTVAETYLALLKDRGVDNLYVGAGTDTAPVVEAYARAKESGLEFPTPIVAAHENLAVGMAHGYYMVSGKAQAVMLHVTVGAANAVCALMNAARARVPMFFTAGRTPLYESGRVGSRTSEIHWAQEMYDQAGMVREIVKWDYELRDGINVEQIVDRGLNIAMTEPRGPVYLTLPREVLCMPATGHVMGKGPAVPSSAWPSQSSVQTLASKIASAKFPVIVASLSGSDSETVGMLATLCDKFAIGVVEAKMTRYLNIPSNHDLHLGHNIPQVMKNADTLLFLESDVPWVQQHATPRDGAFIAHAGTDPIFVNYPVRCFPSDLSITTSIGALLPALSAELEAIGADLNASERRERLLTEANKWRAHVKASIAQDEERGGPITKTFMSRCLDAVRPRDGIVVNEYSLIREVMTFDQPGSFFTLPSAGGLGWGVPAALGAKQAAPDRTVIAVVGDGAYIFANPAACHQAAEMHGLPIVIVVYNNEGWDAVQLATLDIYPDQSTAELKRTHGTSPLASLKPVPDFEQYCRASNGHGERVTKREDLLAALERAIAVTQNEKRVALVNVIGV